MCNSHELIIECWVGHVNDSAVTGPICFGAAFEMAPFVISLTMVKYYYSFKLDTSNSTDPK